MSQCGDLTFFCPSDFTWNQFCQILNLKICCQLLWQFYRFWILIFGKCQSQKIAKFHQNQNVKLLILSICMFLKFSFHQNVISRKIWMAENPEIWTALLSQNVLWIWIILNWNPNNFSFQITHCLFIERFISRSLHRIFYCKSILRHNLPQLWYILELQSSLEIVRVWIMITMIEMVQTVTVRKYWKKIRVLLFY